MGGKEQDRIDVIKDRIKRIEGSLKKTNGPPSKLKLLEMQLAQWKAWNSDAKLKAEDYGYRPIQLTEDHTRSALEELCRWRLWKRTGGGLMAELGSHQLDAASIFCSALRHDGKKARPLTVHATGGRHVFPLDRDAEDHVYCMFEFPGPGYDPKYDVGYWDPINKAGFDPKAKMGSGVEAYSKDPNKKIVVSYSSIMGNGYGGYGEVVMGSKGTLLLEREKEVMLYAGSNTSSSVKVKADGGPSMDTQASGEMAPVAQAAQTGPVSRGYREEIEHWAWCIRHKAPENQPRCSPKVALGDAVIALATNVAIRNSIAGKGGYLQFQDSWYDLDSPETPDGSDVAAEKARLTS